MQILLSTKNISYELSDKILFKELALSISRNDHIGLIGRNGSGKSTLLKILAKEIQPTSGYIEQFGKARYIPQLDLSLFERDETVISFVENSGLSWPLVNATLNRLFGPTAIIQDKKVRVLSGGELAKLLIAIADTDNPGILLLDEPTNHLDVEGLEVLKRYLLDFKGAFIVVSHDPFFLDHVISSLWEIDNGKLITFGGNYSSYREHKRLLDEARARELEVANKEIKKARKAIEVRETRSARAARAGRQAKNEASRDKFAEGYFRGRSEEGTGRLKRQQDQMMEERVERFNQLKKSGPKTVHIDLDTGLEQSKRMLINVSDGILSIDDHVLLKDVNLRVEFGDRLVFTGKNGSGKSSLAKALVGIPQSFTLLGNVKRSDTFKPVYVDQKYQTILPEASILDNLFKTNPDLSESDARAHLGKFLFGKNINVYKTAGTLSGGETARLVLAQATNSPIDILVLDEPTNNLDIETLDIIASALKDFKGAIIVISHNVHFLAALNIERAYILSDKQLKEMKTLPKDEEDFYKELISSE